MPLLSFACQYRYPSGFQLDLAFEMHQHLTALFGPSGSGKSTVLAMIAGFLRPQAGTICVGGRVLVDIPKGVCLPPERRHVGAVYQDGLLFPHLTVEGNLRYGQRHRRKQRRPIPINRVVEVLEIGSLLDRYPRHLSGGQRQRVALGRALLSSPELLLLDEPFVALEAPLRLRILGYLQHIIAQWDIPTLFVTHAQAEVRQAAGSVVVIHHGSLITSGTPEEALSQPEPLAWPDAAGPVNLLRLDHVTQDTGHRTGRIADQTIYLPPGDTKDSSDLFVQFSPKDVVLSRQDVAGLSVRNHLRGRICRIIAAGQAIFVAVDAGQVFWAEITPEAARELDLAPGHEVICLIKAHSLSVIG